MWPWDQKLKPDTLKGTQSCQEWPPSSQRGKLKPRWLSTTSSVSCTMSLGVPLGLKQQKRASSGKRVQQLFLNLSPCFLPSQFSSECSKSITLQQGQVRLLIPNRNGWVWARHLLSGCWSVSSFSSGSNGHEDAYNEILSNAILLPASHSTLDLLSRPLGCETLAVPASLLPLPSQGAFTLGFEIVLGSTPERKQRDTDDFNLCESPWPPSNSSFYDHKWDTERLSASLGRLGRRRDRELRKM